MIVINKHTMLREYAKPLAEEFVLSPEGLLCTSPGDGENEDVGYENWP